jgi:uncharacterized membrane protein
MKNFIYYLKSLIGLFLLSSIVGIAIGITFEKNTIAIYSTTTIMILGFIGLVRSFHLPTLQNP